MSTRRSAGPGRTCSTAASSVRGRGIISQLAVIDPGEKPQPVVGIFPKAQIALLAAANDISVAPHWHANVHAQLAATTSTCLAVEYYAPDEGIYNFESLLEQPLRVDEGQLLLDDGPGIGIEFDDEAIARFRVDEPG